MPEMIMCGEPELNNMETPPASGYFGETCSCETEIMSAVNRPDPPVDLCLIWSPFTACDSLRASHVHGLRGRIPEGDC